jgi:protease-4
MQTLLALLRKLWHGLDVFRRVLHLAFLLVLLLLAWLALRGSLPTLPERGALVLQPSGDLVEQLAGEPLERALSEAQGQGAPQTLLWDLTRAIRTAAGDDRIQAILIDTDELGSAGQAKLEELGRAVAAFRKAGKKVIARGSSFSQAQYYLASLADEVYLDPFGYVLLDGYARYRMYYKGALEKLAIDVHLVRAGKYKSADEPFIRQDMSPEDRAAAGIYLQSLWRGWRASVGAARKLDPEAIDRYANALPAAIQAAGGDSADVALKAGLVTALRTREQVDERLRELVGSEAGKRGFHAVQLDDYLRVLRTERGLAAKGGEAVGVVIASGEILDGRQPPGTIGGETTAELLRRARDDDAIRAVVLRIDSPGGSVFASEQIYREVQALRAAGKPVIASFSDVAASGGYYIAAPADEILASPNTITGSIGVFATIPTFDRALGKLGIGVDGVGTTALSGMTRLDRPLAPEAQQLLQSLIDHTYAQFLQRVAAGRHKEVPAVDDIAQGRVWAGADALRIGLVDQLGGYDEALRHAAERAHLKPGYAVRRIEPELSMAQQLLLNMRGGIVSLLRAMGSKDAWGLAANRVAVLPAPPGVQAAVATELARWQRFAGPTRTWAYCFCSVE